MGPFGNAAKLLLKLLGYYLLLLVLLFLARVPYHLAVGNSLRAVFPLAVTGGDAQIADVKVEQNQLVIGVHLPNVPQAKGRVAYTTLALGVFGYPLVTFLAVMLVSPMPTVRRWLITAAIGVLLVHLYQTLMAAMMVLHNLSRLNTDIPSWSILTRYVSSARFFGMQNQLNTLLGQAVPLFVWFTLCAPVLIRALRKAQKPL